MMAIGGHPPDYVHGSIRGHILGLEKQNAELRTAVRERDDTIARLERLLGDLRLKERGRP